MKLPRRVVFNQNHGYTFGWAIMCIQIMRCLINYNNICCKLLMLLRSHDPVAVIWMIFFQISFVNLINQTSIYGEFGNVKIVVFWCSCKK